MKEKLEGELQKKGFHLVLFIFFASQLTDPSFPAHLRSSQRTEPKIISE